MALQKHDAGDLNGRPIFSLEIAEPLYVLLHKDSSDWPILEMDKPLSILVLCDCTIRDKAELRPLAAWLLDVGAAGVWAWGGNSSEMCRAVDDLDQEISLELFAKAIMQDSEGADGAAPPDREPVTTWYYGSIEIDEALEGFFWSIEMSPEGRASRSVLIMTIANTEWAARVRQRLDDGEWLTRFQIDDQALDGTQ